VIVRIKCTVVNTHVSEAVPDLDKYRPCAAFSTVETHATLDYNLAVPGT